MSKVKSFYKGVPNSGLGTYITAFLDCGTVDRPHGAKVQMKPVRVTCYKCKNGVEVEVHNEDYRIKCQNCGAQAWSFVFMPEPHNDAHRITQIDDEVECETCAMDKAAVERLRNLQEPVFRARFDPRFRGSYHLYRRDHTSPSGVILMFSVPAIPEIDELLRQKSISPLSPTEDRQAFIGRM